MKVKRYEAPSIQEAIQKVRSELGRDAVILHARKFKRGGALGLFGREMVEVIAAVDGAGMAAQVETRSQQAVAVGGEGSPSFKVPPRLSPAAAVPMAPSAAAPGEAVLTVGGEKKTAAERTGAGGDLAATLQAELSTLRQMLEQVTRQLQSAQWLAVLAPAWRNIQQVLLEREMAAQYITELEAHVFQEVEQSLWQNEERLASHISEYLARQFLVRKGLGKLPGDKPLVVALVGPTGVGKTTTVAKLAARYALLEKRRVGLLTVDTYRIAAVEQLKTFAEIMGIPLEVAFTPPEVKLALAKLAEAELILIDTAGRSHHNEVQLAELAAFLEVARPDETHLVLSATTKARDLEDCLKRFQGVHFTHLIFTKLDETSSYGGIFNCVRSSGCPVTYVTFGQNVPDDIAEADNRRLAEMLLKGAFQS
ncbi:MAG: flagellar biosynthesis protein FlhF [Bacillota bacterium]|nr:flagellar biosynthesis protein FlhF [Bacillota bacterium]